MSTKNLIAIASGGLEEPSFGEILSSIIAAIGQIITSVLEQIKAIAYLFSPVDIEVARGYNITPINEWKANNPILSRMVYRSSSITADGDMIHILYIRGNPLLFIFLCLCIIGLGITIYRRLANVN